MVYNINKIKIIYFFEFYFKLYLYIFNIKGELN